MKHNIVISYADEDKSSADQLKAILAEKFGETIWLRDFDLNAGDTIADTVADIVAEVKWFILIYSQYSQKSEWLRREADIATYSAMEREGFELIIVKLDRSPFIPALLAVAGAKQKPLFDLSRVDSYVPEFMRVADYIEKNEPAVERGDIYVDRGGDRDKFSLLLRRNRIIFIVGLAGIGKTAFIKHSVSDELGKSALEIKLTRGHSLDRLAREILRKTHSPQPMEDLEPHILLKSSLEALKSVEKRRFLFLNYAENALDTSNEMLPFLQEFLRSFADSEIDTQIALSTTRNPGGLPHISKVTSIYLLKGLEIAYIQECIQRWIEDSGKSAQKISALVLGEIASLAAGHPLAARFIAMHIKAKGPSIMLTAPERRRMELKLGSYLLESVDQELLKELHQTMLQVLAVIREPMTIEDMLVIKEISAKYAVEDLQLARSKLVELLLIEQDYDLMSINSFLTAYYQDQVDRYGKRQDHIAEDYGDYAYQKATQLKKKWDLGRKAGASDTELNKIANDVFRYTVAADRLLRMTGKISLVSQLPIQISGTIRELVIYYYQHKKDYRQALKFAEEWLKKHPEDTEIILFQVRCYRNIEDRQGLSKAEDIISNLENVSNNPRIYQRLLRERALICEKLGDFDRAELFYRQGINLTAYNPYPENHIGLAHLLLRKLDWKRLSYREEKGIAQEAASLLETARNQSPVFDRFHLGTYINALIHAGRAETAFPLLEDALRYSPDDERLNFRMAEILREQGEYDNAEVFARKAVKFGSRQANLTLANIEYARGKSLNDTGQAAKAKLKFAAALDALKGYTPEFGHDEEVRDGIASKILRELDNWAAAKTTISRYRDSINPYTIYEQCLIDIHEARLLSENQQISEALEILDRVILRVKQNENNGIPQDLSRVFDEAVTFRNTLAGR